MKKLITILICSLLIPVCAQAVVVSGTIATILFAGEVYSLAAPTVSGLTAMAKTVATQSITLEAEQTITSYLQSINEQIEKKESESTFAETEEGARQALNEALTLRESYTIYSGLLYSLRNNKAVVIKETLLSEASSRTTGYIKGQIASYLIDDEISSLVHGVFMDSCDSGKNLIYGEALSEEVLEADATFYATLKEGRATPMRVAITKAEWDKFVNITAKEEFKQYLRGENDFFEKLPMSVQEKYWGKLFLLTPTDLENIHDIMANAKRTGNYADALKVITEKYPYYKQTFIELTKDLVEDSEKLAEKITQGVKEKAQNQNKELERAKEEQGVSEKANDSGMLSDEEVAKFMRDYIDYINNKDLEGVLSYFHPNWKSPNGFGVNYAQNLLKTRLGYDDFNGGTWLWVISDFNILSIDRYEGDNAIRLGFDSDNIRIKWEWLSAHRIIETQPEFGEKEITKASANLQKNDQGEWKFVDGGIFNDY